LSAGTLGFGGCLRDLRRDGYSGCEDFLLLETFVIEGESVSESEEVRSIIFILALIFVDWFLVNNDFLRFKFFKFFTTIGFFSEIFL